MGFFKVGFPLPITGVTGSTSATDHPASNAGDAVHPLRTWRATTTSGSIILNLGSAKTVKAIYVNKVNFPTATYEVSSSATFSADVNSLVAGATVPQDERVGNRRHAWEDFASNVLSKQYVRITAGGTPDNGAGYVEIGAAAILDTVATLTDNPSWPLRWTPRQAKTVTPFPGGGREINVDGDIYLDWVIRNENWVKRSGDTIMSQLGTVLAAGAAATPIFFENIGLKQHAYLLQRTDDVSFEEFFNTFRAELAFSEAI